MTNREWLNSLSNENFMRWLFEKSGFVIFKDGKWYCKEYYPTRYDICNSSTHSYDALEKWLEEERPEVTWEIVE